MIPTDGSSAGAGAKDGETIYAIALGKPEPGTKIRMTALAKTKVKKVSMLGSKAKISFDQQDDALLITPPDNINTDTAIAFKIETN